MAVRTDPARLQTELIVAGIPATVFSGCRNGGPLPTIVWTPGHPTPTEQATADTVLAAHDPDGAEKEDAAERALLIALAVTIDDATTPIPKWRAAVAKSNRIMLRRNHLDK